MIGQSPRARLRLIATDNPDFAATRDLYCRIAAAREIEPHVPDAPEPTEDGPTSNYIQSVLGLTCGIGLGVLILAMIYNGSECYAEVDVAVLTLVMP